MFLWLIYTSNFTCAKFNPNELNLLGCFGTGESLHLNLAEKNTLKYSVILTVDGSPRPLFAVTGPVVAQKWSIQYDETGRGDEQKGEKV